jgi:hypothetical protein
MARAYAVAYIGIAVWVLVMVLPAALALLRVAHILAQV